MSRVFSNDECHCICHSQPDVMHCMPCCNVCPNCGKNIVVHSFKDHADHCTEQANNNDEIIVDPLDTGC